jgi:hypothetical protein
VLANLRKARKRWREDRDKHAFSLTATTGAGKTVMAAAVFEALLYGDADHDFEADPGAAIIWFSDDPSLNEQTRFRLMEASDRLQHSDLVVVQNTFNRERFQAGKIYFLNTQKLNKNSLLVRGHDPEEEAARPVFKEMRPDLRSHTIWDIIQNTIDDPALTLYLVLDEAHRGMGSTSAAAASEKSTIVKRLINGAGGVPGVPIVWGISATVERFNDAMAGASGRSTLPNVVVDSAKVQESGLIKDTIILDVPDEAGQFDMVLLRRATDKIKEISAAWEQYGEQQGVDAVAPLLVFQVPNTPDPDEIGRAIDTIYLHWPDLKPDAIAHVFGDHSEQTFGNRKVPYISPERVQESKWVRVLIAKDAISTGWDCPRAEVMVSFRRASDRTHITQLLGRLVRSPLARRIPGNDRLNSVDCILPFFDRKSVTEVADALMKGASETGEGALPGRRVLINPVEVVPNPAVPETVWAKFLALPSQSLPKRTAKPVKRLTALAQELAMDGLLPDAGKKAHAELHKRLKAAGEMYKVEIAKARKEVMTVEGATLRADLRGRAKSFDQFLEDADMAVIEDAYRRAARTLGADVCRTFAEALAAEQADAEDPEEMLVEAHADIAALGLVEGVKEFLDSEAVKLGRGWLDKYRVQIKSLPDDRQEAYRQLRAMSAEPEDIDLARPKSWIVPTTVRGADGVEAPIPSFEKHMLCREDGNFPVELNTWEVDVLAKEMARSDFLAWYRNPARAQQEALSIVYEDGGATKLIRPDFLFFAKKPDGTTVCDIVDPHGIHLGDALPKLRGIVLYARKAASHYRRIESVAKIGDELRVLDLTDNEVQEAVLGGADLKQIFTGKLGSPY